MTARRVVDTRKQAVDMFKTFHSRSPSREVPVTWTWPRRMLEAGVGQAEMYTSNKWQDNLREFEDYKHIAEGKRMTYVRPGWMRVWGNPHRRVPLVGDTVEFDQPMPKHFCILAKLIGIQLRLFEQAQDGDVYLPKNGDVYEVRLSRGMLGGAEHPETGEKFLFVYTRQGGIGMIITGNDLDITHDGIVG